MVALATLFYVAAATNAQVCEILIDNVTNTANDSDLIAGEVHTFTFRLQAPCGVPGDFHNVTNGFVFYSPEGTADWGYTQGAVLPAWTALNWRSTFVNHFHKSNGSGVFTSVGAPAPGTDSAAVFFVGFSDLVDTGDGLPTGFNNITWTVQIESRVEDFNKHICVDSVFTPPGGTWKWVSKAFNPNILPAWNGPYCWRVYTPCCIGGRGNVTLVPNCDPTDQSVDIADLTDLIDHLFINFTPLCCEDEADVAPLSGADGSVDVGDVSVLIDYLFINFPTLSSCP